MDPKTLANLDPKLRETYERVMGAAAASGAPAGNTPTASPPPADGGHPAASDTPPAATPDTAASNASESLALAQAAIPPPAGGPSPNAAVPPASPSPTVDTAMMTNPAVQPAELAALQPTMTGGSLPNPTEAHANPTLQPLPSPASMNQAAAAPGISPTLRILYFTAGIIFFIVYAVFWLKIFNYPLPF